MSNIKTLYSIDEVLIDFIPIQKGGALKDVIEFERAPGGAPANVAVTVVSMITKLGNDAFGAFALEQLKQAGVNTEKITRTNEANTGLEFVSLCNEGDSCSERKRKCHQLQFNLSKQNNKPQWHFAIGVS